MWILLFLFTLIGPRFATIMWWLFNPFRFNSAFSTVIFPLLGIFFLPWTTLMYVGVFPGGLSFWNWLFLGLAFVADLGSYGSGAYKYKQKPTV